MLIGLLALTIALFGIEATTGPLQVALLSAACSARPGSTCRRSPSAVLDVLFGFIGFTVPWTATADEQDGLAAAPPGVA